MYEGRVVKAFICKYTKQLHTPGPKAFYRSDDLGRMEQLADMGFINFKAPKRTKPSKGGKKGGAATSKE